MIDVCKILYEISEDDSVLDPDCELIESGILDSFVFILFFSKLEDLGIEISPTRINKEVLKTPRRIQKYLDEYLKNKNN